MNQAEDTRRIDGAARHRRALLIRRIGAGLLVAMAVALFLFIRDIDLSVAKLMAGVAGALLLIEALLLAVDLRVSRTLQAVLGVLCIALLAGGYIKHYYVPVDGKLVQRYKVVTSVKVADEYPAHFTEMESLAKLDMRGSTVTDFEPIRALGTLEKLDIRDNYAFTEAEYEALARALPNCDILWSVPVKGAHFDSDAEEVDLRELALSTAELRALFEKYPDKRFAYRVPLLGGRYAPDAVELDLSGKTPDAAAVEDALMLLPAVTRVDLRGQAASAETVSALNDRFPDVDFSFTFDVPGETLTTEDTEIHVTGGYDDLMAYVPFMDYMPGLELLDAADIELTGEQADEVLRHAKGTKVLYKLTVFGKTVSSEITELNLDGAGVPDVATMETVIARLPNLKRVSLLDAGLTQDECGQLFDAHPDIKFVFWIEFGHYKIRTDTTAFSTLLGDGNRYGYNDKTFEPIRYCTDLMMLDLGHNHITNLENFRGLTKMRVLIMADNKITNIDPIADFKDLEFCELFLNDITDMSPLQNLKYLVDLNLTYNPVGDNYTVLKSMTQLKRLWIGHCRLSSAQLKDLKRALPKTKINTEGKGSTSHGWRNHSHYDTLQQMYQEGRYIPFEDSPTHTDADEEAGTDADTDVDTDADAEDGTGEEIDDDADAETVADADVDADDDAGSGAAIFG